MIKHEKKHMFRPEEYSVTVYYCDCCDAQADGAEHYMDVAPKEWSRVYFSREEAKDLCPDCSSKIKEILK